MYARVSSFDGVDVPEVERTMGEAEPIIRQIIEALPGYAGHLELVAANGKVLSITLFDSEDAAEAAEATFDEEMPRKLGDLFQNWAGRRLAVDRYRVLAEDRS